MVAGAGHEGHPGSVALDFVEMRIKDFCVVPRLVVICVRCVANVDEKIEAVGGVLGRELGRPDGILHA